VDAKAAESAGVSFIGVLSGSTTSEGFQAHPNVAVLDSVVELPLFLSSISETAL
jgi:phosphoglycolate phosphatase-like HAD superfamily hydrolase